MRRDRVVHRILAGCIVVAMGSLPLLAGCEQWPPPPGSAYGGGKVIVLEQGMKLVNVTWKMDTIWYTVRPMRPGELPERYEFHADTLAGRFHGEVVIQEKASAFP